MPRCNQNVYVDIQSLTWSPPPTAGAPQWSLEPQKGTGTGMERKNPKQHTKCRNTGHTSNFFHSPRAYLLCLFMCGLPKAEHKVIWSTGALGKSPLPLCLILLIFLLPL